MKGDGEAAYFSRCRLMLAVLPLAVIAQPAPAQVAPPHSAPQFAAAKHKTVEEMQRLVEQAYQSLRSERRDDAVPIVQKAITLADQLPAGHPARIQTLSQGGAVLWALNRKELAESSLMGAVRQMDLATKPVPPETARMTFHMLGVIYRDQRRHSEAVPWFQRAVAVYDSLPEPSPEEADRKFFPMASDLRNLAWAQCRANDAPAAEATDRRRVEACTRLQHPQSANACRDGQRTCVGRWMSQSN